MNKFTKVFKHIFIPHEHNNYKPHLFREISVLVIAVFAIVLFSISFSTNLYIRENNMIATVLPAVLVDLTNDVRVSNNEKTLSRSVILDNAAKLKAQDMARLGYFAHTSPEGLTPWYWFKESGYAFVYAGENLAINFSESVDVQNAWMNSPTHKANLLNDKFTEIGIATVDGVYQGRPTTYVVQMFGSPILSAGLNKKEKVVKKVPNTKTDPKIKQPTENKTSLAVAPSVKGEEINVIEDTLQTITDTKEFIAVKNTNAEEEKVINSPIVKSDPVYYSSWYERLMFMMPTHINKIYEIIMLVVLVALMLMIAIEVKRQHPKNIVYGVLLLIIMGSLMYVNKAFFISSLFT